MSDKEKQWDIVFSPDEQVKQPEVGVSAGNLCPKCKKGILDYDGMLNIVCPICNFTAGGCFT